MNPSFPGERMSEEAGQETGEENAKKIGLPGLQPASTLLGLAPLTLTQQVSGQQEYH